MKVSQYADDTILFIEEDLYSLQYAIKNYIWVLGCAC